MRAQGRQVPGQLRSFLAPGHRETINCFGFIDAELIRCWRPLGPTAVTDAGTTFMLNP